MGSAFFIPHCDVAVVDVAGAQSKWLALWTLPWYLRVETWGREGKLP
jgi:hypothetical protein